MATLLGKFYFNTWRVLPFKHQYRLGLYKKEVECLLLKSQKAFYANVIARNEEERRIAEKIKSNLNASKIEVEDISGGCGSMYRILVESSEFEGKRTIQQHRIINDDCSMLYNPLAKPAHLTAGAEETRSSCPLCELSKSYLRGKNDDFQ
ncbi:uncharacterized protein LOC124436792 [Xenia sp. Carnegie-2017]|uniref:uncharacterized protein LOC124436792 n=1 Tax=Xenia sp. Carnegie-2017 TaxID=2897299 RepID=UPI001F0490F0|nr:uncharacterized protein LOC124436792 [Xenia sp. Carnegie-2017]